MTPYQVLNNSSLPSQRNTLCASTPLELIQMKANKQYADGSINNRWYIMR